MHLLSCVGVRVCLREIESGGGGGVERKVLRKQCLCLNGSVKSREWNYSFYFIVMLSLSHVHSTHTLQGPTAVVFSCSDRSITQQHLMRIKLSSTHFLV